MNNFRQYLYPRFFPAFLAVSVAIACSAGEPSRPPKVFPRWSVAEFTLVYGGSLENPFVDAWASAEFVGPDGGVVKVDGFYDGDSTWKVRFVPGRQGTWKARLVLKRGEQEVAVRSEIFECRGDEGRGFIRISSRNPYRFEWEDGTPYYPLGVQPCSQVNPGLDGPPEGEGGWRTVDLETYLEAFRDKANLYRIQLGAGTGAGCARQLLTGKEGLYRYDLDSSRELDMVFQKVRAHGFAAILIPFQSMSLWGDNTTAFGGIRDLEGWLNIRNEKAVEPVKKYLRYLVARYAAYTDIWELFNEDSYAPDEWLREMAAYVRKLDPYRHILTTNYERPAEPWCEMVCCHEYMWLPASEVDLHLSKEFARFKSFGKPVLYTEFGNQGGLSNKDPVKWRAAVWTAFMNEAGITFWSMGGRLLKENRDRRRGNANAYLGAEAREYFGIFQNFVKDLPITLRPTMAGFGDFGDELSRYALSDSDLTVVYLHHQRNHSYATQGDLYVWTGAGRFQITWLDPATGQVVKTQETETQGKIMIVKTPEITVDMAAKIARLD